MESSNRAFAKGQRAAPSVGGGRSLEEQPTSYGNKAEFRFFWLACLLVHWHVVFKLRLEAERVRSHPQRVMLTGGAGFIGSQVAEALLRQGVELIIVDNLDSFYSPAWGKANLEEIRRAGDYEFAGVDICAMERMREVVARARPEVIIHLAARAGKFRVPPTLTRS